MIPEKAVEWAVGIAKDDSHGYDQNGRWGPDYDCSSLVISAYKEAGLPLKCTYTGNMRSDMLNNGFIIPNDVNLSTGAGLRVGDVLLNERNHTALYIGNGQIVHASGNENGGATGGKTGDQTGKEISITKYFNFPWDYVLRYARKETEPEPDDENVYIVQPGDSLWGIAEKLLGSGSKYTEIIKANNLVSIIIHPGMRLKIPGVAGVVITATVSPDTFNFLQILAQGHGWTLGQAIDKALEDWV